MAKRSVSRLRLYVRQHVKLFLGRNARIRVDRAAGESECLLASPSTVPGVVLIRLTSAAVESSALYRSMAANAASFDIERRKLDPAFSFPGLCESTNRDECRSVFCVKNRVGHGASVLRCAVASGGRVLVHPAAAACSTQGLPSRNPNSDAHENPKTLSILGQRSHRVLPEMLPERFPPGQAVTMRQREVNSMTY